MIDTTGTTANTWSCSTNCLPIWMSTVGLLWSSLKPMNLILRP